MTTLKEFISNLGACKAGADWFGAQASWVEGYNKMPRPEWLLWLIFATCPDIAAVREKLFELIAFMREDIETSIRPTEAARTVVGILGTLSTELSSAESSAAMQTKMQPLRNKILALHIPCSGAAEDIGWYNKSSDALNVAAVLVQLSWARSPKGAAEASNALALQWSNLEMALHRASDLEGVCDALRTAFPANPPPGL